MTRYDEKLSAFLDGALPEAEAREIERALADDPDLQAELRALEAANATAKGEFAAMLDEPVPFALAAAIRNAEVAPPANARQAPARFGWVAAAATVFALLFGGALGYVGGVSRGTDLAAAPGWLDDIADYHRVYAEQTRHLVEVGADEADHIETWLSATVGAEVRIPDLAAQGLRFQGGRLLVAAGKPVAQLMFTDADMQVVALCLIRSDTPNDGFSERSIGAFDMVTWGADDANVVLVGDRARADLSEIARAAAVQI